MLVRSTAVFLLLLVSLQTPAQTPQLKELFRAPSGDLRPWVYWVWMDGNLTREGITADLEAMRQAGIGGVIIMEVNVGIPRGDEEFMSPPWKALFKHAVAEAERLGIEISLITGPGWTGSGGPWVRPERSMQHIVGSPTRVHGPSRFDDTLSRPARRPAFFGDGLLPPPLEQQKNVYYRDVSVLAYPTPPRPDTIEAIDEKALYVRAPYSSMTSVPSLIPSPAEYPPAGPGGAIDPRAVRDITGSYGPGGHLRWDVPPGDWTILRLGATSTGANTRPAPVPGLGLECDKFDTTALNVHFGAFFGELIREIGPRDRSLGGGWKNLHIDSWEMGAQNWTGAFREEFRARRGYDLTPYLPVLTGTVVGSREISERFLWDFRQTAQELVLKNHAGHLKELGRRHGFGLSIEPYDMNPSSDMSLGSIADVPMGEFWLYGFNTSYSVIEATSIAHTMGRPIVAAEAFTSGDLERWDAHPGSMKVLGDWAFASGVNRIVFHRYQHQPWTALRPGMTMGPYGVHWERTQTWWGMAGGYHEYLSRCQLMLRQGLPVADVCYLVAEGAPHVFQPPRSALRGNPPDRRPYNFDGCAPDVFIARAAVKDGEIVFPDGMRYRVIVLPERETMTPALLSKLKEIVAAGGTVIGPPPRKSPGLSGYPRCDSTVTGLARELWGTCDGISVTENRYGKGRVIWVRSEEETGRRADTAARLLRFDASYTAMHAGVARERAESDGPGEPEREQYGDFGVAEKTLRGMGVEPDFQSDATLRYAHRALGKTEIYFVANPSDSAIESRCVFRVAGRAPECWDPLTGATRPLPEYSVAGGGTSVVLRFEPRQSLFIVFSESPTGKPGSGVNFPALSLLQPVEGPWEVTFGPEWAGPGRVEFSRLIDWTAHPSDSIRYFSGVATYRTSVTLNPEGAARLTGTRKGRLWLDLGALHDMARVSVNGQDLGIVWTPPLRVDVTDALRAGANLLEIEVANRWRNRLVGDERLGPEAEYAGGGNLLRWPDWISGAGRRPATGRTTFATWRHFSADSPLLPSGILGPVRILIQNQ